MEKQERKELLRQYMSIPRLSGYEKEMAYRFRDDLAPLADRAVIDRVGNVIATFEGSQKDAPALMIFAHMDVIGFIITCIDEKGFIKVDRMGGVPEKIVAATQVLVGTENGTYVNGLIAAKSYHVQSAEERSRADSLANMFIDIGANSRQEVLDLGIQVGCPVVYAPRYMELLNDRVSGSYLDDASGMVTMLELARHMKEHRPKATVHLVGTVWEEFNARGAMLAARTAKTDMAICLLGPGAGDTPDQKGLNNVVLGEGPAVTMFNFHGKGTLNGCVVHAGMYNLLKQSAEEKNIPLQRSAGRGALSDAAYLQLEGEGIPCMDMGCPDRYSHSMLECLSLDDHERTGALLAAFIDNLDNSFNLDRY
ncbi:MAG: M20/M25/M40 family metallo-hydrolase [Oscillospiraceae bacterium]|nr:M20/M25/M40 family metallo-hydrolase [Oscillospiraceae bacterium]